MGGIRMDKNYEELNENIVRAIMYKVIAEERNFLKQDTQRASDIIKKHMATVKEYVDVNRKY